MFVEVLENLGTADGPMRAGEVYSVPEPVAASLIRAGHGRRHDGPLAECRSMRAALQQMIALASHTQPMLEAQASLPQLKAEVMKRVAIADGKTALFLPFIGEIGWLVMWHMRRVQFSKARKKIVCCKPGQECLYPSADEYFTDWKDPVDDAQRVGTDRTGRQWPSIAAAFPDAIPVDAGGLTMAEELVPVHIDQPIPLYPRKQRGLKVDICVGVRNRKFLPAKNYNWHPVAKALKSRGITFAIIGDEKSSYPLDGMKCMSGDFGDWDSAIELLQNCKLFIGTDSGGAHLASVVNSCPMVVQQVPDTAAGTTRCFIPRMAATTTHQVTHLPPSLWNSPEAMILHTLRSLEQ